MDDLSLSLRHAKRKGDTKLNLSDKGIGIIPQDLYGLTNLEVLDLSSNKITSLDAKIANLINLRFLDLSNNQIMSLPSAIMKLDSLQVLNLSNNPLNMQFEILGKKENQSDPKLKSALKSCFESNTLNLDNAFPSFSEMQTNKAKSDRAFGGPSTTTNYSGGGFSSSFYPSNNLGSNSTSINVKPKLKANWLTEADDEIENKSQLSSTSTSDSNLKKQLQDTEALLSKEQLKVIELTRELEELKKLASQESRYNKGNIYISQKGGFNIDEALTKYMEVEYKLVEIGEKISQGML
jgi:Leucine rich repeat